MSYFRHTRLVVGCHTLVKTRSVVVVTIVVKLWGLTGGIGSGKSTVGKMLRALGATVVNADDVYHELLEPTAEGASPLAQEIVSAFDMPQLLRADHSLDRDQLGKLVFSDADARQRLEGITHPVIRKTTEDMLRRATDGNILYDVPLLFEKHMEQRFSGVIVVWVPTETQRDRLMQRDRLSEADAAARMGTQLPLDGKRDRADFVIDNSGALEDTQKLVLELWEQLGDASFA